jgi:CRP-like cAMP-binding protein
MPIAASTTKADFLQMARGLGDTITYKPGDFLFREGDPPNYLYFVVSGRVEMTSHGKFIEGIASGGALGTVSMVDKNPRSATARVVEPAEIVLINQRQFRYMVEELPGFCWFVMDVLVNRLRATNDKL